MIFLITFIAKILIIQANNDTDMLLIKHLDYITIINYLSELSYIYRESVTLLNLDRTHEYRMIPAIKISSSSANSRKPAVLIDSGIHGREWMSSVVTLYVIDQMLRKQENSYLYKNVDWYFVPLVNPDGYEYARNVDYLWRKNRSPNGRFDCPGVDLNRNFDFQWEPNINECSDVYPGLTPNSEIESLALINLVLQNIENIKLYTTVHSFGSYLLYPYAYGNNSVPNKFEHQYLATKAAEAIEKIRGTILKIGVPGQVLYNAPGSTMDWMIGVAKIPLAFAVELPDSSKNFDPPVWERLLICQEFFEIIKEFHSHVENKWLYEYKF